MIKFAPSGFCDEFSEKYKSTEDMAKWLTRNKDNWDRRLNDGNK